MGENIIYILNCVIYCFNFHIYSICLIDDFVFVYGIHHIDFNIRMLWLWQHHVLGDWAWDFLNKAYLNFPAWQFIFLQLISIAHEFIEGFKMLWKFSSKFFLKFFSFLYVLDLHHKISQLRLNLHHSCIGFSNRWGF